jgi:hypothetical protein
VTPLAISTDYIDPLLLSAQPHTAVKLRRPLGFNGRRIQKSRTDTTDSLTDKAATDTSDRMLSPDIFRELQDLTSRQFTLDACCNDNGSNALVSKFCSKSNSFLETDVQGEHVWLNPPFNQLREFISHYLQCKAKSPHTTSACILVPKWRARPTYRST